MGLSKKGDGGPTRSTGQEETFDPSFDAVIGVKGVFGVVVDAEIQSGGSR